LILVGCIVSWTTAGAKTRRVLWGGAEFAMHHILLVAGRGR